MNFLRKLIKILLGEKTEESQKRKIFFDLLRRHRGSITVMDFAMATNCSGTEAKKALEQYAVEFDATFEVTEEGDIIYRFPLRTKTSPQQINSAYDRKKPSNTNCDSAPKNKRTDNPTKQVKRKVDNQNEGGKPNQNKQDKHSHAEKDQKQVVSQNKISIDKLEEDFKNIGQSLNDLFKF